MTEFGNRLKMCLARAGMSQKALAKEINYTECQVSRFCNGKVVPMRDTLVTIAKMFNVSVGWLLGFEPDALDVLVKYHAPIEKLEKIKAGDWIDLRAAEDVDMAQGDSRIISLGVSMRLPEGYEAHVLPRSSTFEKFGIVMYNSMGIIDNSYGGTNDVWGFPALAARTVHIKRGDRIAQFRIVKNQPRLRFEEVEELGEERGGFGSTGVR